ncbi:MAG: PEP-CTERM/exosortase system-associated acyltransferase [Gammaproteobacteria bacterium]|nr:PEP-CTERM/exosortase system-associated acyltransferase [Gammaproteobacteria bacterium]
MQNIITHFNNYFEIVPATTREHLQECHKLRYQTFCVEKHYFIENEYKNSSEIDEYDTRSAHSLILHKDSGLYAASVRLVLPSFNRVSEIFPIESHLTQSCRHEYAKLVNAPREHVAEISRLLISKHFRQRTGESSTIHGIGNDFGMMSSRQKRQFAAQISLGLFKAIILMSEKHEISYWLALMEPQLIRLLARIGIHFKHLSKHIKYCGDRHVCFENGREVLLGIHRQRPDIWAFITDEGKHSLKAHTSPPLVNIKETALLSE